MGHSKASRRFVVLASLTALIGGAVGIGAPVLARDPSLKPFRDLGPRVSRPENRFVSSFGTRGMVDPKKLPQRMHALGVRPIKPVLSRSASLAPGTRMVHPAGFPVAPDPIETTPTTNPPVGQPGYDGFYFDSGPNTATQPPDPWVAAGPDHVIQIVNLSMQILDRSGNLIESHDLADFFQLPPDYGHSDPRVIFDSLHQRWVMSEVSWVCDGTGGAGYLDYLVSSTADPTDPWRLDYFGYDNFLPDYPAPGTSTVNLAFTANMFQMDPGPECLGPATQYAGIETLVTDWAEVIRPPTAPPTHFKEFGLAQTDYFTPRIAVQTPATSPTLYSVVQFTDPSYPEGPIAGYDQFSGSAAAGTVVQTGSTHLANDFVVAPWIEPTPPQQPDSMVPLSTLPVTDRIDSRPTDAIWQANKMTWVSTHGCAPTGDLSLQDCVRVTQINTSGASFATPPTAVQDFLIAAADTDNYFGGIGQALDGTLHVVWTSSSASIYPSSYAGYQLPDDPAHSLSNPELLKSGSTSASFTGGRWGDYNGVAPDPQVPNAVWQANMYSGGGPVWKTFISQLQTGGSSYVPITPLRVVDSRTATGVAGIFNANVPQTFSIAGAGPIPANAVAVTGNVTVAGQTAAGYVAITPSATTTPQSSTLNFPLADNRANNFTIPLAANGRLAAVYKAAAGKKAHIIVDITGYFVAGDGEATYKTMTPVRVLDTRPPPERVGPLNRFQAGVPQTLSIANDHGVPPDAVAITANLTITGQTRAGYVSVTPDPPIGAPGSSTINMPLGDNRANGLTARLNGDGDLTITYTSSAAASADLILDVTGFYVPDNSGLLFYPLTPGRILDSRPGVVLSGLTGLFNANSARVLDTDGHWGVPLEAEAITGNLTVVNQTAAGYISITPNAVAIPNTSTMNFPLGDTRANGVTVPLNGAGNLAIVYRAAGGKTNVIIDVSGYFK